MTVLWLLIPSKILRRVRRQVASSKDYAGSNIFAVGIDETLRFTCPSYVLMKRTSMMGFQVCTFTK